MPDAPRETPDPKDVAKAIEVAFADAVYPGDDQLRDSSLGDEPFAVEQAFRGRSRWQGLDPAWLDQVPDGLSTALCFLSDAGFRFYLPAYLLADLQGQLERVEPSFYLTHDFVDQNRDQVINPRWHGEMTWGQRGGQRCDPFTATQRVAIVEYLRVIALRDDYEARDIDQALRHYWLPKLEQKHGRSGKA